MQITGRHLIAGEHRSTGTKTFTVSNPLTGEELSPPFAEATRNEVDKCLVLADRAFEQLQTVDGETIAQLLDAIADGLAAGGEPLLGRIHSETALPIARLEGECARTVNQTRMFAQLVREGGWVQARIDRGAPDRTPQPKPDVRSMLMGIGPIAVFGASNFPLAISVAGTDTIAAFAARCPVVVKGHPGHPGTCELVANIIATSIKQVGLPSGMFALLQGSDHEVGMALVEHPLTAAVAFTGSLQGGRALFDAAARREEPIPVYAEMGSTNPVFVLPRAAQERAEEIAAGYVQSVTMGVGQFCTNPGLLFIEKGEALSKFSTATADAVRQASPATMLHGGIHSAFESGVHRITQSEGVQILARADGADPQKCQAACTIFTAPAGLLEANPGLTEEVFGPSSIVFSCNDTEEMYAFARSMHGHLTATIHGTEDDLADHAELVRILQRKVGRIVFNGFPTGIEVCAAIHHGGPYPATTHGHFTSIGSFAIYRFTRPVCFQNFPDEALPKQLRNNNESQIPRLIDGKLSLDSAD